MPKPPPPPPPPPAPSAPPPPPADRRRGAARFDSSARADRLATTTNWVIGFKAVFVIGSGIIIALLGPFALGQVRGIASEHGTKVSAIAVPFLNYPWLLSILCLPAIAAGVWALVDRRRRWIAITLATLIMLAAVLIVLLALVSAIAPLYQSSSL
ncbi:MAG: hypothetical protein U0572_17585 [Phycisphaerales bacterium]